MENHTTYEQEIDLKDLLFAVLYKWRVIMIAMIILGVLAGGYKVANGLMQQNDAKYIEDAKEKHQQDIDEYERLKNVYEREIENINMSLETQTEYMDDSILMNISPYDKGYASADIFVKMEDISVNDAVKIVLADYGNSVVSAYTSYIRQGMDYTPMAKQFYTEKKYLQELIKAIPDYEGDRITVEVCYQDEAGANQILDMILENVNKEYKGLDSKFGPHNIYVMNQTSGTRTDTQLDEQQKSERSSIPDLQDALQEKEKALEDLKEPGMPVALSVTTVIKSGIKYAVLGCVLGAFAVIFCLCVAFLMTDKMASARELKKRYGLKVLAEFPPKHKKRVLAGIDRWLEKLEGKRDQISEEARYDLMAANLRNYAGASKNIMIIGTVGSDILNEVAHKLGRLCMEKELMVGANLNEDPVTVSKLPECDAVILVEENGVSRYSEIEREIESVSHVKKDIIGVLVI